MSHIISWNSIGFHTCTSHFKISPLARTTTLLGPSFPPYCLPETTTPGTLSPEHHIFRRMRVYEDPCQKDDHRLRDGFWHLLSTFHFFISGADHIRCHHRNTSFLTFGD